MAHVVTYTKSRLKLAALHQADEAGRGLARLDTNEELAKLAGMMLARYPHLSPAMIEELEKEAGWWGAAKGLVKKLFTKAPTAGPKVISRAPKVQMPSRSWAARKSQIRAQQAPPSAARQRRLARAGREAAPAGPVRGGAPYRVTPPPTTPPGTVAAPAAAAPAGGGPRLVKRTRGVRARQPGAPAPAAQAPAAAAAAPAPAGRVATRRGGRLRAREQAPGSRAGAPVARQPGQAVQGPAVTPPPAAAPAGTVQQGPAGGGSQPGFLRRWWKPMALGAGALGMYGVARAGGAAIRMAEQSRQSPWAYGAAWSPVQYGYGPTPYGQFQQSMGM